MHVDQRENANGWAKSVWFNTNDYNNPDVKFNPVCKKNKNT